MSTIKVSAVNGCRVGSTRVVKEFYGNDSCGKAQKLCDELNNNILDGWKSPEGFLMYQVTSWSEMA